MQWCRKMVPLVRCGIRQLLDGLNLPCIDEPLLYNP
ncbi:unnamed protein product [uncultured bacterium]|nr:unnamed protein product [uncultured bacterium]